MRTETQMGTDGKERLPVQTVERLHRLVGGDARVWGGSREASGARVIECHGVQPNCAFVGGCWRWGRGIGCNYLP